MDKGGGGKKEEKEEERERIGQQLPIACSEGEGAKGENTSLSSRVIRA